MEKAPGCCMSSFFSAVLLFSLLFFFSLQSLRFGIVAMLFEHLWPAGSIIATLLFPFGPAMGGRLVRWARDVRPLGPGVRWLFPADPQVSPSPPPPLEVRGDALRAAMQEGLEAAGIDADLKAAIESQNDLLQELVDGNQELLEEMRQLRANTYTVSCTITPQAG
jgi:hypothetical protein